MNWGQMKAALNAWSNRTDVAAQLPTFLELAEQRIYFGTKLDSRVIVEPLRISPMLTATGPLNPVTQSALPTGFLEAKTLRWNNGGRFIALDFVPLEKLDRTAGAPAYYSLSANQILFGPTFSNEYDLLYYKRFATPALDTDTNWLLDNASGVYLFALMMEVAGGFLRNDNLHAMMRDKFVEAMNSLQSQDDSAKHSGNQLRITSDTRRLI